MQVDIHACISFMCPCNVHRETQIYFALYIRCGHVYIFCASSLKVDPEPSNRRKLYFPHETIVREGSTGPRLVLELLQDAQEAL